MLNDGVILEYKLRKVTIQHYLTVVTFPGSFGRTQVLAVSAFPLAAIRRLSSWWQNLLLLSVMQSSLHSLHC